MKSMKVMTGLEEDDIDGGHNQEQQEQPAEDRRMTKWNPIDATNVADAAGNAMRTASKSFRTFDAELKAVHRVARAWRSEQHRCWCSSR
jgi:hypothetical protein